MSRTRQRRPARRTFSAAAFGRSLLQWGRRLRARWRRTLVIGSLVLLLGPPGMMLIYRVIPPPLTPLMLIRLVEGEGLRKDWTSLADMPASLPQAAIASEDNRFCTHGGFDWVSINAAIEDWRAGKRLRGGSTISMQTAKNLFLWPDRSWVRKALEAWLTPQLELLWPKRRIMEVYLNIAEMGPGVYGVAAAAEVHFGKSVEDLSSRESALIMATLPNPRAWSAGRPSRYINGRARTIQVRMRQLGPLLDCVRPD